MASLSITVASPVAPSVVVTETNNVVNLTVQSQSVYNTVVVSPVSMTNYYAGGGEVSAALTGVTPLATDLGTFTGTRLADNLDIKTALQDAADGIEDNTAAIGTNAADISQAQVDLSTETSARTSADTSLQSDINANTALIANLPGPQLAASLDPTELSLFFTDPGTYSSGTSLESVLRDVLIHYQTPSITSFVANGIPTGSIEHGATDTVTTATWSTVNPSNLDAGVTGSITYYDPVGTDGASYTGVAYTASPYTLNKDVTFLVTAGTAGAASTSLAQANTYYLRLSGLQNTQGTSLSASSDFFTVNYKTFVLTSPTQINASSVNSTSGNQLLADCAAGTNGSTEEHNGLHPNSRRQTTLSYPDTANYWYLCMPQCHWEYANKITTNQGFVGFDITTTVVDCGAFVYTNAQGADVNMQLLRGSSIGQIGSGNYIKVEYDSGSPLNSAPPPVAEQPASSSDLLLDTYTGAAAAYSVRKLDKDYTGNCMKVRRDSDDAEADIGFDGSGGVDQSAIATHCGASNGFVSVWYDMSGNANNATQATSGSQPQIYNGTAVITANGKPILTNPGSRMMDLPLSNAAQKIFGVMQVSSSTSVGCLLGSSNNAFLLLARNQGSSSDLGFSRSTTRTNAAAYTGTTRANALSALTNQTLLYVDFTTTAASGDINLGFAAANPMMEMQECIIYPDTATHTISDVETDINNHFAIGNLPNPTSGLLFDYPDAAAAYSVRQLANTAPLSMRVREDATDTETNIGFDANGDLDTAAIAAHCGSANGYVVTWYDQSGNANNAIQNTSSAQPQIYNGTAVLTLNGKPAVSQRADNYNGTFTGTGLSGNTLTVIQVVDTSNSAGGSAADTGRALSAGSVVAAFRSTMFLFQSIALFATASKPSAQTLGMWFFKATDEAYQNGTQVITGNGGTASVGTPTLLGQSGSTRVCVATNELIIYLSDQSTNRIGMETDINDYYQIPGM